MDHISFPLSYGQLDFDYDIIEVTTKEEEWQHKSFSNDLRGLYVINRVNNDESDIRLIYYKGYECGVWALYTFQRYDGKWQLVKIEDYST